MMILEEHHVKAGSSRQSPSIASSIAGSCKLGLAELNKDVIPRARGHHRLDNLTSPRLPLSDSILCKNLL